MSERKEQNMNQLPETIMDYRELHQIVTGPVRARLMMTGIELRIFNRLETFLSAEDVARDLGTHPENTRRLLDALVTIDLLEKENGLYRNMPISQTFLVEGSPTYMGALFQMVDMRCVDPLTALTRLVKDGPAGEDAERDLASQELWAELTRTSAAWPMGMVGRMVAGILSKLPGFSDFEKMLDLGGGHGIFALYIVNQHPFMKGTVFDRAPVVEVAREFIHKYGMEDRVDVAAGDYMTDDIGQDYDLIWACSTLNFAKWDLDILLKKIYEAVRPGGYFVSFQDGMTHEHTKPDTMLGHLADQLTTGIDFSLDQGAVAESALRCGFQWVRSRTIETPMGPMDMDIARK
jgi:predicted O-methyltransferase YrrM